MTYVVDTSVIVKWLAPENENNITQAEDLLATILKAEIKAIIPDLAIYELTNALIKGKGFSTNQAIASLDKFFQLPLIIVPYSEELIKSSVQIATQNDITIYDASFITLAKENNALLITANPKHQAKVTDVKVLPLADFSTTI